jgi:hypothetical protein
MVWVLERRVFYHSLDWGFEQLEIPVRVKFEFEVREGTLVRDSLSINRLYNRQILEKRYPGLDIARLENSIERTVNEKVMGYMRNCGFLKEQNECP